VAGVLERTGLDPELLQLEITEDTVLRDPVRVLDVVARASELGVTFALDDFGTGYSSLAYLKQLPINELKIDRSFVSNIGNQPDDEVIVRSTVELARGLGLRVTAEGVESQASWDRLASFGCHNAQGFLLSRPLPPGEFATWLAGAPARHGSAGPPRTARLLRG
jgi:EAL domain-containing protein (putative c-di-GMP-specific phosphodiesterase class I)